MAINWNLKVALVKRFGSQIEAAKVLGIRENRLSYIVRGHVQPTTQEREALECLLGQPVAQGLLSEPLRGGAR